MNRWTAFLHRLEQKASDLKKPIESRRERWLAEFIVVFAVVVWMGAMTLLP